MAAAITPINQPQRPHAIEGVTFALEFSVPLTSPEIRSLAQLHPRLAEQLPRKLEGAGIIINLGQGASPVAPPQEITSVTFDSLKENGQPKWALKAELPFISVYCGDYTRWDQVWAKTIELLTPFMEFLQGKRLINGIGFQCVDKFKIEGSIDALNYRNFFNDNTKYITKNIFDLKSYWHNHHGYFDVSSPEERRLDNINISLNPSDNPALHFINIQMTHNIKYLSTGLHLEQLMRNSHQLLNEKMMDLHNVNKRIIRAILTEEMSRTIGLEGGTL